MSITLKSAALEAGVNTVGQVTYFIYTKAEHIVA